MRLNQIMRGWSNYFKHAVAKHIMSSLENFVWHRVIRCWKKLHRWRWKDVRRHHTGRNGPWVSPRICAAVSLPQRGKARGPGVATADRCPGGGCLAGSPEGVHDVSWDPAAAGYLITVFAGPRADRCGLSWLCRCPARADGRPSASSPDTPSGLDPGLERRAQFFGILCRQVDLVGHSVESEGHRLVGRGAAVEIIDERHRHFLGHFYQNLPASSGLLLYCDNHGHYRDDIVIPGENVFARCATAGCVAVVVK